MEKKCNGFTEMQQMIVACSSGESKMVLSAIESRSR